MIRIKDPRFIKTTPAGQTLDVVSIEQYVIDDRQARIGSPMDRTQLVWGTEREGEARQRFGAFAPHSYDDPTTTQQVYFQASDAEAWQITLGELPSHPMGSNLREAVLYMMEAALVAIGRLGDGAEVVDEAV